MKSLSIILALLILAGAGIAQQTPVDRIQRSNGFAIVNPDGSVTVTTYAPGGSPREVKITPRDLLPPTPCTELAFAVKSGTNAGLYQCFAAAWKQWTGGAGFVPPGAGTVSSITAGNGLTATPTNPITGAGTLALAPVSGVAGTYNCANLTVDATGRVTSASSGACGGGTVSSVGVNMPPEFTVTGSPVTGSGTVNVSKASQAANTVYAAPNGAPGAPGFRPMVAADVPGGVDLTSHVTLAGDVSGPAGSNTLGKLQGNNLNIDTNLADGSILGYNSDNARFENSWNYNRTGFTLAAPTLTTSTNITVGAGGTQTKSGGTGGTFDAGSIATNSGTVIASLTATAGATTDVWCIGLSNAPASVNCTTFNFAIRHNADGTYSTLENGVVGSTSSTAANPGDLLTVEKVNTRVRYKINSLIFRVVAATAGTSVTGVTSISTAAGVIREPLYYYGAGGTGFFTPPVPPSVDWIRFGRYASFQQRTTTPPTPVSGQSFFYPRTDGFFYRLDNTGTERQFLDSGTPAGGDLTGTLPNPVVNQLKGRSLGGIPAVAGFFSDNFDVPGMDTTLWTANPTATDNTQLSEASGALVFVNSGGGGYAGYRSTSAFNATGKFETIQVVSNPAGSFGDLYPIRWSVITGATAFVAFGWNSPAGQWTAQAFDGNNGFWKLTNIGCCYNYLRLREASGVIFWDTSPDNVTWTNQTTWTITGGVFSPATVYIDTLFRGTSTGETVTLDNLTTNMPLTDPITSSNFYALSWDNSNNRFSLIRDLGVIPTVAAGSPPSGAPSGVQSGHTLATVETLTPTAKLWIYNPATNTWTQYPGSLTNTAALDFPSTAAQSESTLTITVTGAADGDVCSLGVPNASAIAGGLYRCYVSAANTVTVKFANFSAGALDPASGTFRVQVSKF